MLSFFAISMVIALYALINFYIGLRGWQVLGSFMPFSSRSLYWGVFWCIVMAYFLARLGLKFLPRVVSNLLNLVGSYWMAAMLYLVMIIVFIDLIRILDSRFAFVPAVIRKNPQALGLGVLILVVGLLIYGTWNARHHVVTHYDLTIDKSAGNMKELHAVMVSDIHLNSVMNRARLKVLIDRITEINPDIVLLAGDIVDESVQPFIEQNMSEEFKRMNPKYGTFAVLGNHEYFGNNADGIAEHLKESGIRVLRDERVKVADSFVVAGREDKTSERMFGKKRDTLQDLLKDIDNSIPVILMDHQPVNLDEAMTQGVDMQLSWHTHRGQLFPNQLITSRIYENDWGYLHKGSTQIIVSSGFGTWGPPVRIGSISEIVDITIHFKSQKES